MSVTTPTGARPRRGRPRHHESPRARARAGAHGETATVAPEAPGAPPAGAQLTSVVEVDLTGAPAGAVVATVAAAAVRAAAEHPVVVGARGVHLAVLAADGATQAVVADADELTAAALAARIDAGHESGHESGHGSGTVPTLSVVDTGSRGVLADTPAVGPSRAAVLGIGAVVRRPAVMVVEGGEAIVVRAMAHLSLSYDPRLLAGGDAADFLRAVQRHVEEVAA
jgi:pyruvate dehydrogenase E2 component (dihydrolipoamide acetyltransferase)